MNIQEKYDAICAFGPLSFARFHPWVRHLKIQLTLNEKEDCICVDFIGACTKFEPLFMNPSENSKLQKDCSSKEKLETALYEMFLYATHLDATSKLFTEWTLGCADFMNTRNSLYLDYKFAKAAQLSQV